MRITQLISFPIILSTIALSFSLSCRSRETKLSETHPESAKISERAKNFLSGYESTLKEQEEQRAQEEEQRAAREKERATDLLVNQTIDEMLALDPQKDERRIDELISDLKEFGERSLKALEDMLAEQRPVKERVLLVRALGAFVNRDSGERLYDQAIRSPDREVREAALTSIKGTTAKDALVNKAIGDMRERTPEEQMRAIALLGAVGGDPALSEIIHILDTTENDDVKRQAIMALGEIGGETAISTLNDILLSDGKMRVQAAQALGRMRLEDVVLGLGRIVSSADATPDLKLAAAEGLGADNGKLARTILLHSLKDERQAQAFHQRAVDLLIRGFGDESAGELPLYISIFDSTVIEYLPQTMQPLLALGKGYAADELSARYDNLSDLKKIHAIRSIGRMQDAKALAALDGLFAKETDTSRRCEILEVLKRFNGKEHAERTADILRKVVDGSQSKQEKAVALRYLGEVAPADASKTAAEWLAAEDQADAEMLKAGIDILKRFGDQRSRNALLALRIKHQGDDLGARIDDAISTIDTRSAN